VSDNGIPPNVGTLMRKMLRKNQLGSQRTFRRTHVDHVAHPMKKKHLFLGMIFQNAQDNWQMG
jgi:hypothetical protein